MFFQRECESFRISETHAQPFCGMAAIQDAASPDSSDYESVLNDDAAMLTTSAPRLLTTELDLARMQSEHALSMLQMRHDAEVTELQEVALANNKALRKEIRRRERALLRVFVPLLDRSRPAPAPIPRSERKGL